MKTRRDREKRRRRCGSISAGPREMWQSATLLKPLLISTTQLSQPYFTKIKRPYGKRAWPRGKGRGLERTYVNKLAVCRCSSGSLLPQFGSPLSSSLFSFWHDNGSELMKTLQSPSDNTAAARHKHFLHTSSCINHGRDPPSLCA